ncbi:uncharacterized protein GGS22DRAFT_192373 [Annulohypoxylon maeteangense]|uniref:uncharacterized protein n=1 Tax=Annulohypoxylon maeteangense TaxID=1927788 RepID=UPI002008426B|nr:uncharacterized protein GGS22DRAFT_192373 [Annulohypoxylon maeteangense]KAI0881285.1 hypothetical protein GGS22DRAFT_192373 [Annulohypoxylon maeteangense]
MPSSPLRDLHKSENPDRVTHEIILVHGFKSCLGSKSRSTECRRILKSWITSEIEPISSCVNVRTFSFDSEHILHNGRTALYRSALELSDSLTATKDSTSPLFCSTANGHHGRSSRAAIFIAHGMGMWVVKEALKIVSTQTNRIDPTGLFSFDIPEALVAPNPIVNISTRPVISQYLHEFSKTFKIEMNQEKLQGLQFKIEDIDANFHRLTTTLYGRCEEIRGQNSGDFSYTARSMCHNIWMSSTPALTFKKQTMKRFSQQITGLLRGCKLQAETPIQKLGDLGLGEELHAAISSRGIHSPRQELRTPAEVPNLPVEAPEGSGCPKSNSVNASTSSGNTANDSTSGQKTSVCTGASTTNNKPSSSSKKADSCEAKKGPCHCPKKRKPENTSTSSGGPIESPSCSKEEGSSAGVSTTPHTSHGSEKGRSVEIHEAPTSCHKSDKKDASTTPRNPTGCSKKGEPTSADKSSHCTKNEELKAINGSIGDSKNDPGVDVGTPCPGGETAKGKEKEHVPLLNMSPVYLPDLTGPLSGIFGRDQGECGGESSRSNDPDKIDDEFDFDNIIAQRNIAAAEDDEEALRSAVQKLEILKFHQKENFEKGDHRTLITEREIVKTSIEYGWWNGNVMKIWEERDILEMEDQVRKVYEGLKQSLGPHHRETIETLTLLLALGISGLEVNELPTTEIQAICHMVKQKQALTHEEAKNPRILLQVLALEYKAAHGRLARP